MELNGKNVIKYLIRKNLLSATEIISGGIEVEYFERKNISLSIKTTKKAYLIKQSKLANDIGVICESKVYTVFRSLEISDKFKDHIPKFISYDEKHNVLIIELLIGDTLDTILQLKKRPPAYIGKHIATILYNLHNVNQQKFKILNSDKTRPWVLSTLSPPVHFLSTESSGAISLIKLAQADSILANCLIEVNKNWRFDAICHNDIRLNNLFCSVPRKKNKTSKMYLIDFELCGYGNSLWDLACFFESYVQFWVISASKKTFKKNKIRTISDFHKLIFSFWNDYKNKAQKKELEGINNIISISKMVGLRMLQSSMEYSQNSNEPTRESILLLESAKRFCKNPLEAWVHILGIPLSYQSGQIKIN